MTTTPASRPDVSAYAWVVFALTFGLLISDYMARQVLSAVFPLAQGGMGVSATRSSGCCPASWRSWSGMLTFPISLLADRVGRVRSIAAMAVLWSFATLLCGLAANYEQMLAARVLVGVGEAAYGSVGIAVIISVFPERLRATLTGAFMAGGLAWTGAGRRRRRCSCSDARLAHGVHGHRHCGPGAGADLSVCRDPKSRLRGAGEAERSKFSFSNLGSLFSGRALNFAYVGSGAQLFVAGALPAWLPTYFVRYYGLPLKAGHVARRDIPRARRRRHDRLRHDQRQIS